MADETGEVTFHGDQIEVLRDIVEGWIAEGFTTPPYSPEHYDIFEALGIENGRWTNYDVERPK